MYSKEAYYNQKKTERKNTMSSLQRAEEIARQAHAGQTDKAGQPYINHPLTVASSVETEELKTIAMLHDVVEDCREEYSFDMLREEGFSAQVIGALEALTRGADENYWDYIRRVADNDLAMEVKLADLAHNSDRSRIPNPTPEDNARWEKYRKATTYLEDVKAFKAKNTSMNLSIEPFKYIFHRKLYAVLRDDYVALCDTLKLVLESMSKSVCPTAIVQGRAKNLDSFTEKCARKAGKYGHRHFEMMTDLCGTRVILQTLGQVGDYCELLKKCFVIDWANSENTGARLGNDQFGYQSQHFIVSLRPELTSILGVNIDTWRFKHMKAEIQVRTLAQHINADTLHDRLYKSTVSPLDEHWREGSKIAAMAEILDSNLHTFVEKYDRFSLHQQSYMSVKRMEEELSILEAMNFGETYLFTLFANSLKMAMYLRSLGRYTKIVALLQDFVQAEEQGKLILDTMYQTRLWYEYGLALLASHQKSHRATQFIDKALKNYRWLEKDRSKKWQEARHFYVFMALTAGTITGKKDWLDRALRVDFTNPYACAELLSHTDLDSSLLHGAIAAAEEHLRGGVNEPEVYFVLGRLWLALQNEARAADYYVEGMLFYLSAVEAGNMRVQQILERESGHLKNTESGVVKSLCELINIVYDRIYEGTETADGKTVIALRENAVLTEAANAAGYATRILTATDLPSRMGELASCRGYLFLEADEELLAKAALILGLRVISTNRDLNLRFAQSKMIRKIGGFYTLPCETDGLLALFTERKSYLTEAQIDAVAGRAHEKYVAQMLKRVRETGVTPPDLGERTAFWKTLKETYKVSNIDQAAYAPIAFERMGYTFTADPEGAFSWDDFSMAEQEQLAKTEHGRWNAERVMAGWCYYPKRDNGKLLHNLIVAWDELSEDEKYFDKSVIDNFAESGLYLHRK
jgi:ppGpp synthetase/RelA/SpoT-type nucleotidyltranferase